MNETIATKIVKGGGRTIFVDVRKAKNDAPYVCITTLGRNKDGDDERRTITVFGEQFMGLHEVLQSIASDIKKALSTKTNGKTV